MKTFDELVHEATTVPVEGWDFSWFRGRATEQRPAWGYARVMGDRMTGARSALDLQTGGGEVLAAIPQPPPVLVATEGWPPNVALAREHLAPRGGEVVEVAEDADLPFPDGTFDLVVSRHPVAVNYREVARVLAPSGTYLSQHVGRGSLQGLTEAVMGPQPVSPVRDPSRAVAGAAAAGLVVVDLKCASLRVEFFDVGAVIVFLRKVIWMVPGFTVGAYLEPLRALHERIEAEGAFVAHSTRFLLEARRARRPGSALTA